MFPCKAAFLENFLDSKFRQGFGKLGYLVGKFPAIFVVALTALSLVLGLLGPKFALKETSDVSQLYTPLDAPAHFEHQVAVDFFQSTSGKPYALLAILRAKNGDNLFEGPYPAKIRAFKEFLSYNLTVEWPEFNRTISFSELCLEFCDINDRIDELFVLKKTSLGNSALTYPTMMAFNRPVYLGNHIYSVDTYPENGTIRGIVAVALQFRATIQNSETMSVVKRWENRMFELASRQNFPARFRPLNITIFSRGILSSEVRRSGMRAAPYLGLSFGCLLLFTVISCLKADPVKSKPWEAVAGVFCPVLALMTSFGSLILIGLPFLSLLVVTPFLVLAVGVDDAFLLLHGWQKSDAKKSVPERLAQTLSNCGPAITLTSLTNAVSFAIGSLSPTPAIQYFCTYTSFSVVVAYFYQLTFFAGAMALGGRREEQGRSAYSCLKLAPKPVANGSVVSNANSSNSGPGPFQKPLKVVKFHFLLHYCQYLNHWAVKLFTLLAAALYWTVAIYGSTNIRTVLSSEKLISIDSPLQDYVHFERDHIWSDSVTLTVFVNHVPDLTDSRNIENIRHLVQDFQTLQRSRGPNSTNLWILDYLRMVNDFESFGQLDSDAHAWPAVNFTYDWLADFFLLNPHWSKFVKMSPDSQLIDSFFFTTSYGDPKWNWNVWGQQLLEWRAVASRYPLNVTIYHGHIFYADQMLSIPSVTFKTVAVTFICMAIACAIFIPHPMSIFCALLSLASINVGVLGFLTLWGVNLDPISMATILMSIGLSVDFVSHVSYHYFKNAKIKDSTLRLEDSLNAVGWPLVQAGISTVLSVSALALNHAYMTDVFVKTILLVVVLGLLHGLVLLPVLLLTVSSLGEVVSNFFKKLKKNKVEDCSQVAQEVNGIPLKF